MGLYAVAGSKIYIGRRVATPDRDLVVSDFYGAPWVEVKGWAMSGSLGDTQEAVTQNLIGEDRTSKGKGTRNGGRMDNTFLPLANDPGQARFAAAIESCSAFEFKVEWNAGCLDDGDDIQADLFHGLAFPGPKQGGEANTAQMRTWAIEVNSNIVESLINSLIPVGALTFSDGTPLQFSDGSYLELAA